jgi:hypothetical protein
LRSTINNIGARPETIPSRTWLRSVPHVTRMCIVDDGLEFRDRSLAGVPVQGDELSQDCTGSALSVEILEEFTHIIFLGMVLDPTYRIARQVFGIR